MYRVETHNNSKEYFKTMIIEDDVIYITANSSISNMIKELNGVDIEEQWRIEDIEKFIKGIYPTWNNTVNKIKLKSELRKVIRKVKSRKSREDEVKEIEFFEDNLSMIWRDFTFLIEGGVSSVNKSSNNLKLTLISEIFNEFISNEIFKEYSKELLNINSFIEVENGLKSNYIKSFIKRNPEKGKILERRLLLENKKIKKIYFYNISNLDLKRYMIIEMLKLAGYEIEFRIPHFKDLKVVNKCWTSIYNNRNLFDVTVNNHFKYAKKSKLRYINFIEGTSLKEFDDENVAIKSYREVSDFKRDLGSSKFVTFYKDSLSSCLSVDDRKFKNHCYQSAIGRFIFNLYKCKVDNNDVLMDFTTFREMITSGWIEYKDWNGLKLVSYLIDNEEYFSGVKSINEIINRIEKIKDIEEVSNIFEDEAKNKIKKDKTKAFLSNPFRAFGYTNLESYNVTANYMLEVASKLKRFILKGYEGDGEIIKVEEHLNNLVLLFRNKHNVELFKSGSKVEQKVLKKIYGILNNPTLFGYELHRNELEELFNVYLFLEDEDSDENEQEKDFSIDQLEGVVLRDRLFRNDKKKRLLLADLSFKTYDKHIDKNRLSGKVLSMEEVTSIFNDNLRGRGKEIVLTGMSLQEKSMMAYESYVKFAIVNLLINFDGNIEFSWIEGLRNDDSESTLLKQIESIYENKEKVYKKLEFEDMVDEEDMKGERKFLYDVKELKEEMKSLPEVAFRDLDFCGDKFLYSSILEGYPVYYSEFHHKLIFSSLVSILKNSIEDGYSNLYNFVLPLFPQWEDVVKKNILDCEYSRKNFKEYRYFDGLNYPKNIYAIYLLKSKYIVTENSKIRNKYNKGEFNGERYYKEFIDEYIKEESSNNGLHCKMCPHCYICKKGDFVIDSK